MTLALKTLRLMLMFSAMATVFMAVFWLGMGNLTAKSALVTQVINLVVCLFFTTTLAKGNSWIGVLFAIYCGLLLIGSKMGGFTLTTAPVYVMAILSLGGLAGIMRWLTNERHERQSQ